MWTRKRPLRWIAKFSVYGLKMQTKQQFTHRTQLLQSKATEPEPLPTHKAETLQKSFQIEINWFVGEWDSAEFLTTGAIKDCTRSRDTRRIVQKEKFYPFIWSLRFQRYITCHIPYGSERVRCPYSPENGQKRSFSHHFVNIFWSTLQNALRLSLCNRY